MLPAVAAAASYGFGRVMVAEQNAAEAALVPGVRVIAASSLTGAADWLRGTPGLRAGPPAAEFDGGQEFPRNHVPHGQGASRESNQASGESVRSRANAPTGPGAVPLTTLRAQLKKVLVDWDNRLTRTSSNERAHLLESLPEAAVPMTSGKISLKRGHRGS